MFKINFTKTALSDPFHFFFNVCTAEKQLQIFPAKEDWEDVMEFTRAVGHFVGVIN